MVVAGSPKNESCSKVLTFKESMDDRIMSDDKGINPMFSSTHKLQSQT